MKRKHFSAWVFSLGFLLSLLFVHSAPWITWAQETIISSNTTWPEGIHNITGNLAITNGATLTVAGGSTINISGTLSLVENATLLLQGKNNTGPVGGLWVGEGVTINAGEVIVTSGSKISADGQGYTPGLGPGGAEPPTSTSIGGSYGGRGSGNSQPTYGSATNPTDLGSAGGGDISHWSAGGGAIRLNVSGTLLLDGEITADGTNAPSGNAAGGSGGSIYATIGVLSGSGLFSANGGPGAVGAKGGGGRIAVHYGGETGFSSFTATTASAGGDGAENGTSYYLNTSENHLRLVSQQMIFGPDSVLFYDALTIDNGALLVVGGGSTLAIADTLTVTGNATLLLQGKNNTGQVDGQWVGEGVTINAGEVIVTSGSKISADGQGYTPGLGPGGAEPPSNFFIGGSYGGRGSGNSQPTYGSATNPTDLGSAGGGDAGHWSAGGGAIRLNVSGTLLLDGEITADGTNAPSGNAAGGAGGSVYLHVGNLSGSGLFSANGGPGAVGAKGGGGRIAIHHWGSQTLPADQIIAAAGGTEAEPGTVYGNNTPVFGLILPPKGLFHGTELLAWEALALNPAGISVTLLTTGSNGTTLLGSGLPPIGRMTWDTTMVPDGVYELRAIFRDASSAVAGEAIQEILVRNSGAVVWHGGTVLTNEIWPASQVHIVERDVTVPLGVSLFIEPGAVIKFAWGTKIIVADGGIVDALGAAGQVIVFTALTDDISGGDTNLDGGRSIPTQGYWNGCQMQGTGQFNHNNYTKFLYMATTRTGVIAASETWLSGYVYSITGDVTIPAGVTVTVEPGVVVKFNADLGLTVQSGGRLVAEGSVSQPIFFTSFKDDSVGGDNNGDGNGTAPAAGDWKWIHVNGGQAAFDHVELSYGGGPPGTWSGNGTIRTSGNAALTLANSRLRESFFDGVLAWGGPVTISNSVFNGNDRAVCAHPGSTVTVTNSTLDDNRIGLLIHGGTLQVINTIVTNSSDSGIDYDSGSLASVRYTNVWVPLGSGSVNYRGTSDRTGTNGNISVDPEYKNRQNGNYRLNYQSPGIDAADGALAPAADFMGAPRYDDPRTANTGTPTASGAYADMGAYEFVETADSNADLIVSSVTGPLSATSGENAIIQWTITNIGSGNVAGPWHDTVYLVRNPDAAPEEILAGEILSGPGVILGPGESYHTSGTVRVPGSTVGPHKWQIKTNARGEIFEGSKAYNNRGLSSAGAQIDLRALIVGGAPLAGQFDNAGQPHWFKLSPPAGQDVLLRLDLIGDNGTSELYVGKGFVPTPQYYTFRQREGSAPDVTGLLTGPREETYYVMVYPHSLSIPPAGFNLSAASVEFSLLDAGPSTVGNGGPVTLKLEGGMLLEGTRYELIGPDGSIRAASSILRRDSSLVYVTFDLNNAPSGLYSLRMVSPEGTLRMLENHITVQTGTPSELRFSVSIPRAIRRGRITPVILTYENPGNRDLSLPFISVISQGTGEVRPFQESTQGLGSMTLLAPPVVPGLPVMPPGSRGQVTLYYTGPLTGQAQMKFYANSLEEPAFGGRTLDWEAISTALMPAEVNPDLWGAFIAEERARYGETYQHLYDYLAGLIRELDIGRDGKGLYVNGEWLFIYNLAGRPLIPRSDPITDPIEIAGGGVVPGLTRLSPRSAAAGRSTNLNNGSGGKVPKVRVLITADEDYGGSKGFSSLSGTQVDAQRAKKLFKGTYNLTSQYMTILTDKRGKTDDTLTGERVKREIIRTMESADPGDLVVIWNSSHGTINTSGTPSIPYLVFNEPTPTLSREDLGEIFNQRPDVNFLLISDTCYSGHLTSLSSENVVVAAGGEYGSVADDGYEGGGIFSSMLAMEIEQDPGGDLVEACRRAQEKTFEYSLERARERFGSGSSNKDFAMIEALAAVERQVLGSADITTHEGSKETFSKVVEEMKKTYPNFDIDELKRLRRLKTQYIITNPLLGVKEGTKFPAGNFVHNIKKPATDQQRKTQEEINPNPPPLGREGGTCYRSCSVDPNLAESNDPNAKTTVGYGPLGFIPGEQPLLYTIYFENVASASAPAQRVVVTDQLLTGLDWATVELFAIGFNDRELLMPSGVWHYQTTTFVATDPNPVRVQADFDPGTGIITWVMESVDPVTGREPADPYAGFLPPNKPECNHCGEGFVSFLVWPNPGLTSGVQFENRARIVFDINPPIDTPEAVNTIDTTPPSSSVIALAPLTASTDFTVRWEGSDNTGGSGIAYYDVYVSVDGGALVPWFRSTTQTSAIFRGARGHTYGFYSLATDYVGNRQTMPTGVQTETLVLTKLYLPIIFRMD